MVLRVLVGNTPSELVRPIFTVLSV